MKHLYGRLYIFWVDGDLYVCHNNKLGILQSLPDTAMGRRFFVGGNWKMNGTRKDIDTICSWLKEGPLDPNCEVLSSGLRLFDSPSRKCMILDWMSLSNV
jgi:hypothetical protein